MAHELCFLQLLPCLTLNRDSVEEAKMTRAPFTGSLEPSCPHSNKIVTNFLVNTD